MGRNAELFRQFFPADQRDGLAKQFLSRCVHGGQMYWTPR
jgi:hypothetical protein